VAARYICRPSIFDQLERTAPGKGDEIQLTDALRTLLHAGGRVLGVQLEPGEKRYDVGNFESYFHAFVEAALADSQYGPSVAKQMRKLLAEYPED
jgi:UTP--glucose-1-phosphate uridylyltransferase